MEARMIHDDEMFSLDLSEKFVIQNGERKSWKNLFNAKQKRKLQIYRKFPRKKQKSWTFLIASNKSVHYENAFKRKTNPNRDKCNKLKAAKKHTESSTKPK